MKIENNSTNTYLNKGQIQLKNVFMPSIKLALSKLAKKKVSEPDGTSIEHFGQKLTTSIQIIPSK